MRFDRKIGNFVITSELDKDPIGAWCRGVKTNDDGSFASHATVRIVGGRISGQPGTEAKLAAAGTISDRINKIEFGVSHIDEIGGKGEDLHVAYSLFNGKSLHAITEFNRENNTVELRHVLFIMQSLAHGLVELFRIQASHGFLNPHSVWIGFDGTVKLMDAGVGGIFYQAVVGNEDLSNELSPYSALKGPDWKRDTAAFGLMFFELITGESAIPSEMSADRISSMSHRVWGGDQEPVPEGLSNIIGKCLGLDGGYSSPSELLDSIRSFVNSNEDLSSTNFDVAFLVQNAFKAEADSSKKAIELETEYVYTIGDGRAKKLGIVAAIIVVLISIGFGFQWNKSRLERIAAKAQLERIEIKRQSELARLTGEMNALQEQSRREIDDLIKRLASAKTDAERKAIADELDAKKKRDNERIEALQKQIRDVAQKPASQLTLDVPIAAQAAPMATHQSATESRPSGNSETRTTPSVEGRTSHAVAQTAPNYSPQSVPTTPQAIPSVDGGTKPTDSGGSQGQKPGMTWQPLQPETNTGKGADTIPRVVVPVTAASDPSGRMNRVVVPTFDQALLRSAEGQTVDIKVMLDEFGNPRAVRLTQCVKGMESAFERAMMKSGYNPIMKEGRAVRGWIAIRFKISGGGVQVVQ
jgi:hypothetical protein